MSFRNDQGMYVTDSEKAEIEKAKRLPVGIHYNVPAARYHADPCERPSLSSSIAKILIEKTPRHAWYAHPRLNPDFVPGDDSKFNLGSAVHELMLGKGAGYTIVKAADYRGKDAQAARQRAREEGRIPLLHEQYLQAVGIANEASHNLAQIDVQLEGYRNEGVLVWEHHGLPCRAMVDSIGRGVHQIWDIKTTVSGLSDSAIARSIVNYGYDLSAAFYIKGLEAVLPELVGRVEFRWIFVETEPPYELRVIEADPITLEFGKRKAEAAMLQWAACMSSDVWPGWPRGIGRITYPSWAESAWLEKEMQQAGVD